MYKGEAPDGLAVAVKVMALSSETAEEARGMHVCIRMYASAYGLSPTLELATQCDQRYVTGE